MAINQKILATTTITCWGFLCIFFCCCYWNNYIYFCILTNFLKKTNKKACNWCVSAFNFTSLFHTHFKASPISKWLTLHLALSTAKDPLAFVSRGQLVVLALLLFPVAVLPQLKSHMDLFSKYQALVFLTSFAASGYMAAVTFWLGLSRPATQHWAVTPSVQSGIFMFVCFLDIMDCRCLHFFPSIWAQAVRLDLEEMLQW